MTTSLGNVYYGWVVVLAAAVIRILVYGISYTSGVVYVVILENFKTGAAETSWISSLITAMTFLITPLAGVLVNKFGWRVVTFCGGLMTCGGLLLSTLSTNLILLCLFYGVMTGAGCGIAYMSGSLAVPKYFQHKKIQNLAVGLASAGGGVGAFIFPPVVRYLDYEYGWKGMFMILGGIALHMCVFGLLYRPIPNTDENENPTKKKSRRASSHVPEPNDWTFLKRLVFHFVSMNNFLFSFGSSIIYGHLAAYAQFHLNINKKDAAFLYSVIGISITIAKISQGLIADHHKVHPIFKAINQYIIFYLIGGLATSFLLVVTGYGGLVVYCILFGASMAANGGSLIPAILMEMFGQNKLSLPYAVVLAEMSIGQILGAPVAGWIYEDTKNYHYPFLLASAFMIASAIIMVYPRRYLMRPHEDKSIIVVDIDIPKVQEFDRFLSENESKEATSFIENNDHIKEENPPNFIRTDDKEDQQIQVKTVSERTSLITPQAEEVTCYYEDKSLVKLLRGNTHAKWQVKMTMCLGNVYYGWVVVLVAAIIRILVYGISYTSGVVYVIILENFKTGAAETSWISSLITAMTFVITPLAGVLVNKFGWRVVTFCGGLLTCGGLLLSTLSTNLFVLCLFYGVLTGAGCGIAYMSGSIAVPKYFQHKKIQNLAVGLASAGGGLGSFVFPPIVRYLNFEFGWKGMFMILGGIALHICVFGLLYRPLPNIDENENPTKKKSHRASSHVPEPNDWTFLKSLVFHFVSINNVLFSFGSSIIYGHLAAYAQFHLHINKNDAAFLYSIIGISITIAKISQGLIADYHKVHPIFKAINQYIIFYLIGGLATPILLVDIGYGGLIAYCILFGASNAANGGSLIPAILMEMFGPNKLSLPYAVVLAEMSIGQILGAPIAGWMYDSMENYHYPFLLSSASMIVSAVIMVYPRQYLMRPRQEKSIIVVDIEIPKVQNFDKFLNDFESKESTSSNKSHDYIQEGNQSIFLENDREDEQTRDKVVSERTSLITTQAEGKNGSDV
ncbi:uncharacterized protein LOC133181179 [Saccostrea echinata]|uniref:uncharacterized protein LOC133181179 n=1 Tax=Saccostrea echinata TaxID=191078 RepID=UPI002A8381DC|nr:uncharacterized protein LOC133181179 [Saccostrea echinata]